MFLIKNHKYLIFVVIGVGLLITAFFIKSTNNKDSFPEQKNNINFNVEVGKGKETREKKLDTYNDEIKDSLRNNKKTGYNLSNFGKLNNTIHVGKQTANNVDPLDAKIDSILEAQKIVYNSPKTNIPKTKSTRKSHTSGTSRKLPVKKEKTQKEKDLEALRAYKEELEKENKRNREILARRAQKNNTPVKKHTDAKIYAMINGDQNLASGERITMRLSEKAVIEDIEYPRNTFVYGFVKYAKNRIYITISNINNNPVNLAVYDGQDGGLGLYTKVNILSDGVDKMNDRGVNEINTGNSTVGRVLNSAKDLLKKKNKPQKILLFNRTKLIFKSQL